VNFLETIIADKRARVEEAKEILSLGELTSLVSDVRPKKDLKAGLFRKSGENVRIIAEIKRASPSKGAIAVDIEPVSIAKEYERGGASAISILTEASFFKGSTKDFREVREAIISLPLLRKDFIVDEYQVYESILMGADAILLIVAALGGSALSGFIRMSKESGLAALVEVHDDAELDIALSSGAEIIGVNNRNLVTFEVSPSTSERLAGKIPGSVVSVSESGISGVEGVREAGDMGYHAVLVGEHFMRAADREAEVRKLAGQGAVR
jgi:indole-3-glycerol phosphate synthase